MGAGSGSEGKDEAAEAWRREQRSTRKGWSDRTSVALAPRHMSGWMLTQGKASKQENDANGRVTWRAESTRRKSRSRYTAEA